MSTKQTEALKLALDWYDSGNENPDDFANMIKQVIALAQQPAQGCDYCNHPQYAGTKCKNCGREQPAQDQGQSCYCPECERLSKELAALKAQQQQEPVAVYVGETWCGSVVRLYEELPLETPLYTSPPASKPWVGLTEEEVDECYYWKGRQWTTDELVRHVEAKLREKNA